MSKPIVKKFIVPAPGVAPAPVPANDAIDPAARAGLDAKQPAKQSAAQKLAEIEQGALRQRRILNLTKSVMPIVNSIIVNPGAHASATEKADAIRKMSDMAMAASALLLSKAAPSLADKGWANADAFMFCASIIGSEWRQTGSLSGAEALLDPGFAGTIAGSLADADEKSLKWLETSGNQPAIKNETEAATRIRLSLLKASAPLLLDVNSFSFWRQNIDKHEADKLAASLINNLSAVAAENSNRQADHYGMDADHRIMLWQGTIARVFEIAREEYRTLANRALSEVDGGIDKKAKSAIRKSWAIGEKGDIAMIVAKTADNMIRLLDGIVSNSVKDAIEFGGDKAGAETKKRMKP